MGYRARKRESFLSRWRVADNGRRSCRDLGRSVHPEKVSSRILASSSSRMTKGVKQEKKQEMPAGCRGTRPGVLSDDPRPFSGLAPWKRREKKVRRQNQTRPSPFPSKEGRRACLRVGERGVLRRWAWRSNVASSCGGPKHRWGRSDSTCPRISRTWADSPAAADPSCSPWSALRMVRGERGKEKEKRAIRDV